MQVRDAEFGHCHGVRRVHAVCRDARRDRLLSDGAARCAGRALEAAHADNPNALFGIVQGGMHEDLRDAWPCSAAPGIGFDGYADRRTVGWRAEEQTLRGARPRRAVRREPAHRWGVGTPEDIVAGVLAGVDMFDCVLPTRNARNEGRLHSLRRPEDPQRGPPERTRARSTRPAAAARAAGNFTRAAYLHHLQRVNENLGARLATPDPQPVLLPEAAAGLRDAIAQRRLAAFVLTLTATSARAAPMPAEGCAAGKRLARVRMLKCGEAINPPAAVPAAGASLIPAEQCAACARPTAGDSRVHQQRLRSDAVRPLRRGPDGLPMILIFVVFYFWLIRPQQKKESEGAPEHARRPAEGRRSCHRRRPDWQGHEAHRPVRDVEIAPGVETPVQRSAIAQLLPKGTIKTL